MTLKEHRNKRIAHSDLPSSLNLSDKLPGVSRQTIEDLLASMRDIMNGIKDWHNAGETNYDVISPGGADSLVRYLKQANRLVELQRDLNFKRLYPRRNPPEVAGSLLSHNLGIGNEHFANIVLGKQRGQNFLIRKRRRRFGLSGTFAAAENK